MAKDDHQPLKVGKDLNYLFVGGPGRSGTTAFADYLNDHPNVLICRERFKWWPTEQLTPSIFTPGKILDFEDGYEVRKTGQRREYHAELLAGKELDRLKWIGDKTPDYVNVLETLAENNPGASFILMYRPIEEVAESFHKLSQNPNNPWLGGKDGFKIGIRYWNRAMRHTRDFIENGVNRNTLVIGYHDFFYRNEECVPLISRFLDLEFDESVRRRWRENSEKFEGNRRRKEELDADKRARIEENADREAEEWVLHRIEQQWKELELHSPESASALVHERRRAAIRISEDRAEARHRTRELQQNIKRLEDTLEQERKRADSLEKESLRLEKRLRNMEARIHAIQSSRSWRLLTAIRKTKTAISGRVAGKWTGGGGSG